MECNAVVTDAPSPFPDISGDPLLLCNCPGDVQVVGDSAVIVLSTSEVAVAPGSSCCCCAVAWCWRCCWPEGVVVVELWKFTGTAI